MFLSGKHFAYTRRACAGIVYVVLSTSARKDTSVLYQKLLSAIHANGDYSVVWRARVVQAMSKLGLKAINGVSRVTIRKSKNVRCLVSLTGY